MFLQIAWQQTVSPLTVYTLHRSVCVGISPLNKAIKRCRKREKERETNTQSAAQLLKQRLRLRLFNFYARAPLAPSFKIVGGTTQTRAGWQIITVC